MHTYPRSPAIVGNTSIMYIINVSQENFQHIGRLKHKSSKYQLNTVIELV
jgi:hypothetical protein